MSVKVSVIVPVFNPGEGIKKCISCLTNQTLKDIELIFVDDCGTDNSMSFVEEAALIDKRIRIIANPENIGAGPSRNRGIDNAKGEFLSFIDPDDYVFPDFLERLFKKAERTDADIVKGVLRDSLIEDGKETIHPPSTLNPRIEKGLRLGNSLFSLFYYEHTTAIYRRETILREKAYYGTSSNGEDIVFLLRICYGSQKILFEDRAVYIYVERDDSNNRKASIRRLNGEIQSVREMLAFMEAHDVSSDECSEYLSKFITKILEVHKVISQNPDMRIAMERTRQELKFLLMDSKILPELKKNNMIIGAFVDYNINLALLPYSRYWYEGRYVEYKKQIETWVDFLCAHPGYEGDCQPTLWRVFEAAIVYDDWENETEYNRKDALKEVRRQAHRLPDRKMLTDNFISMKLFIDYGINTFSLRDSKFGNMVKRFAVLLR